ncbi:MAG TPA: DUF2007 domain-containing protein [Candidatus Binatia bacterium]
MATRLTTLEIFSNEIEAGLARERLEAAGIGAYITKDDAGGTRPDLQFARGVRLLVSEEDVATAKELLRLEGLGAGQAPGGGKDWTCAGCSEIIEGQFTECWQCGTRRPS